MIYGYNVKALISLNIFEELIFSPIRDKAKNYRVRPVFFDLCDWGKIETT